MLSQVHEVDRRSCGFGGAGQVPELNLYTRYEHGNLPVRVHRDDAGQTRYSVTHPFGRVETYPSARRLISSLYGRDLHVSFDRYFRLGRYRREGRPSGEANLLTLLDSSSSRSRTRSTPITVHARNEPGRVMRGTRIVLARSERAGGAGPRGGLDDLDPDVEEFVRALEGDLRPLDEFVVPTEEMVEEFDRAFRLELDRVEELVGIDLGEQSLRSGSRYKADEVRRLLWKGFAGRMLSQGYDPEEVLQEIYKGLLVRNGGRCPWDARKSTFGHYVHMVISCVLTNYHRKQVRRIDRDAVPLEVGRDGEDRDVDVGQWGSCDIWHGSEVTDQTLLVELAGHLDEVADECPEAQLGREILPLVRSGWSRQEIATRTGHRPSFVSKALAWLRRHTAAWALQGDMAALVPARFLAN